MTTNNEDRASITELKQALVETFLDRIVNGVKALDSEGNEVTLPCPEALLKIAAAFVKDFEKDLDIEKLVGTGKETSKIIERFKSRAGITVN